LGGRFGCRRVLGAWRAWGRLVVNGRCLVVRGWRMRSRLVVRARLMGCRCVVRT
jgi:hypothetical protein